MTDEEAEMLGYEAVFAAEDEETPLYTHAQLVEERRRAWNEAIEAAGALVERLYLQGKPHERHPLFIHNAIRALQGDRR